jgi:pimeloyl-ACP methyl ester carboxylesterase
VSTPRSLRLPPRVRRCSISTDRGVFAALAAQPARGVCERRPALLVPGYTGSKEDFLPVFESLAAAGRRVFAIDMRGQYQSQPAAGRDGYSADELAADIAAIAQAVAEDDSGVHLLGHSFGGLIARQATLAGQTAIGSLTLLGSGPARLGGQRAALLRTLLAVLDPQPAAGQAAAAGRAAAGHAEAPDVAELHSKIKRLWEEQLEPQERASGTPPHIVSFLRKRMLGNCPVGLVTMARYLLCCPDRTSELAALDVPVLVMYGENDDAWPTDVQNRMARRLGARRVCIPGAAHSPAVDAPETTASTLTQFWNDAERAGARRSRLAPSIRQRSA